MQHAVLTGVRAWQEYERWLALPDVEILAEPEGRHERFGTFATALDLGPASWADAYLAAFTISAGCRMVTFNGGFTRYAGVGPPHLVP